MHIFGGREGIARCAQHGSNGVLDMALSSQRVRQERSPLR